MLQWKITARVFDLNERKFKVIAFSVQAPDEESAREIATEKINDNESLSLEMICSLVCSVN